MTQRELEVLRAEIQRIDHDLVDLVFRRLEAAEEIGRLKSRDGLRIKDRDREKVVLRECERRAKALGMDPEVGRRVAQLMISLSVSQQKTRKPRVQKGSQALVVGGAGRMGEWACRFLSTRGATVSVYDPRGRLKGYRNLKALPASLKSFDIIVIASPLGVCPDDLEAVLKRRPSGLVFDLCSVKAHIAARLRAAAERGVLATSVHPMFGPNAPSPKGRNVVVCKCGNPEADKRASELFSSEGANVIPLDIEAHDELMTYVLGLSHLCTLLFSGVLTKSGVAKGELAAVEGPSFARLSRMALELSYESRRVYHDIQALNPNTRHMLSVMEEVLRGLRKAALDSDADKFRQIMDSNESYLGVSR